MTIEQRLSDALHSLDDYQPSVDLFARTARSIAEDRAHRRRMVLSSLWLAAGVVAAGLFVATQASTRNGELVIQMRAMVGIWLASALAILFTLGPVIRRYGHDFLSGAFAVNSETGARFSKVLDLAYYLAFGGGIIVVTGWADLDATVTLASGLAQLTGAVATLFLFLGVAHALNLVAIPLIALIVNASTRRVLRHATGESSPPESAAAERADRVAKWTLYIIAAFVVLQLLGFAAILPLGLL